MARVYVGVDVSKGTLDVSLGEDEAQFTNDKDGITKLIRYVKKRHKRNVQVIMEATGVYHMQLVVLLDQAKVAFSVVNPRQVRDFAKAMGQLAKTDRLDAKILVQFGEAKKPDPTAAPTEKQRTLAALVSRREQLVKMRVMETNRMEASVPQAVQKSLEESVDALDEQIEALDAEIAKHIDDDPDFRAKADLLMQVKGVGPAIASGLLATLPELGKASKRAIAKLTGVAPLSHDSGKHHGERTTWGGRSDARGLLYMAALVGVRCNPPLKAFYEALLARGKSKKEALIACARRLLTWLNAMVRDGKDWDANKTLPA